MRVFANLNHPAGGHMGNRFAEFKHNLENQRENNREAERAAKTEFQGLKNALMHFNQESIDNEFVEWEERFGCLTFRGKWAGPRLLNSQEPPFSACFGEVSHMFSGLWEAAETWKLQPTVEGAGNNRQFKWKASRLTECLPTDELADEIVKHLVTLGLKP
jgi:hypothetical protein